MAGREKGVIDPITKGLRRHIWLSFHECMLANPLSSLVIKLFVVVDTVPLILPLLLLPFARPRQREREVSGYTIDVSPDEDGPGVEGSDVAATGRQETGGREAVGVTGEVTGGGGGGRGGGGG